MRLREWLEKIILNGKMLTDVILKRIRTMIKIVSFFEVVLTVWLCFFVDVIMEV